MRRSLSTVVLTLLLLLAAGVLHAAEAGDESNATRKDEAESSNMQSWQDDWRSDEKNRGWTWFGMGYESRRASSESAGGGSSGGPAKGPGGNGAGGGGKRR